MTLISNETQPCPGFSNLNFAIELGEAEYIFGAL